MTFYMPFFRCTEKDIDNFVEEEQTVQNKLDDIWLSFNRPNFKVYFK